MDFIHSNQVCYHLVISSRTCDDSCWRVKITKGMAKSLMLCSALIATVGVAVMILTFLHDLTQTMSPSLDMRYLDLEFNIIYYLFGAKRCR